MTTTEGITTATLLVHTYIFYPLPFNRQRKIKKLFFINTQLLEQLEEKLKKELKYRVTMFFLSLSPLNSFRFLVQSPGSTQCRARRDAVSAVPGALQRVPCPRVPRDAGPLRQPRGPPAPLSLIHI